MAFGKPKTRKIQTDCLPGPIAISYRRIFTRHEPDVERLLFILDTAEMTARFLSTVVLATLRELHQAGKIEAPLIDLGDPSKRLKKPSFGLWMEILREGARRLLEVQDLFEDDAAHAFAMDVCQYVFDRRQKMKGRPYADLDAIVVIRNKVHHPDESLDIPSFL